MAADLGDLRERAFRSLPHSALRTPSRGMVAVEERTSDVSTIGDVLLIDLCSGPQEDWFEFPALSREGRRDSADAAAGLRFNAQCAARRRVAARPASSRIRRAGPGSST